MRPLLLLLLLLSVVSNAFSSHDRHHRAVAVEKAFGNWNLKRIRRQDVDQAFLKNIPRDHADKEDSVEAILMRLRNDDDKKKKKIHRE
ncbi:unnamed protein product [Caenorhabditis auriculariae]|uniref:Uncharacterized protein n=1 Tax=Caenorhabditis auriculariae TaxID=2777116 RepID=A0A8S1GTG9_9PELO|nr:unnamed protein product [Caenorhabditis auriculariae]